MTAVRKACCRGWPASGAALICCVVWGQPAPQPGASEAQVEFSTSTAPAEATGAGPTSPVIAPLPDLKPPVPKVSIRVHNAIDNFVAARWDRERVRPARIADDATFARRVYLDIAGVTPTLDELGRFLESPGVNRARLIDELLASPRYADHWTAFWGDLLRETTRIQGAPDFAFRDFIRQSLRDNVTYDAWVRKMLTATGAATENPATTFLLRNNMNPDELTVSVTQVFLGMQLRCVQCHDSLTGEAWKQSDFRGVAGFFSGTLKRVDHLVTIPDRQGRKRERKVFGLREPRQGEGRFFTGAESSLGTGREGLADLVTRPDNPYFARVAVNRLWAKLMGIGLVDPPDGFGPANPASHPELLDWLALEFTESGYDLKHVIRLICNSRTYQLESAGGYPPAHDDRGLLAQQRLKRLTAEQLWDSVVRGCGLDRLDPKRFEYAIEHFYPPRPNSFLAVFEAHDRGTMHDRNTDATIPQALALMNGPFINQAVRLHRYHPVRQWRQQGDGAPVLVRKLFMHTLSREPTDDERRAALAYVRGDDAADRWSDVHWALINTREFMFVP